jgi:16S rRNA (guanine527-N7)-methyltransferase
MQRTAPKAVTPPNTERLRPALVEGAEALGWLLTPAQEGALLDYLALLGRWNQVYNLTAVRDPVEMLTHHLLDCLAVVRPLRAFLADRPTPRLLDVGSGGGLPGVVLALLCPEVTVTCVDTVGKKAAFIRQAAALLRLPNLTSTHARVETLPPSPGYDLITARAFASLSLLEQLTHPLLRPGGVWAAMKGQRPDQEIAALPARALVFHVEQVSVPGLGAERCLVWIRPATDVTNDAE